MHDIFSKCAHNAFFLHKCISNDAVKARFHFYVLVLQTTTTLTIIYDVSFVNIREKRER